MTAAKVHIFVTFRALLKRLLRQSSRLSIFGHVTVLDLMVTAGLTVWMYTSVAFDGFVFSDPQVALFIVIANE